MDGLLQILKANPCNRGSYQSQLVVLFPVALVYFQPLNHTSDNHSAKAKDNSQVREAILGYTLCIKCSIKLNTVI